MNDPFDLLGIEPRFELDLTQVELRHRELSRVVHPDRHTSAPPSSRRVALSRAIEINQAFATVKDPVRRAEALLRRHGITVEEGREKPAEPLLLMELLELGESLAEARRARDLGRLEAQAAVLEARKGAALSGLSAAFRELETGSDELKPAAGQRALSQIGVLRFTQRLVDEAALAREELES